MELIDGPERRPIVIADYDPAWPANFERHAAAIRAALGAVALEIHHIGSTSIPGLAAKPIIDMLLVVANSSDETSYLPPLERVGYVLRVREPEFFEHRMLRTPDRAVHLHVFTRHSPEIDRHLLFRDHLRGSDADRRLYELTKRQLALIDWPDTNSYADAKSEVIASILQRAKANRDATR